MAMELNNAFSTSVEAFLLSKHKMYSITVASQGNVILPSSLVNPNSSPEILRSSLKTAFPRYTNGTRPISSVHDAVALACHCC
ncbi:hypothetical protein C2845_PM03G05200 [Panicum miliaceum]|uniref:Uncharacterized protein n=1 Tax=Panicum miliaceum TaxID=4540 RepID=A0A3L6T5M2_PANMI|nr:hypothetical protein C2845_PM03G05200 [Panicum miliaceum]